MKGVATRTAATRQSSRWLLWISEDGLRWAIGIAIAAIGVTLFLTAVAIAPASVRANNTLCLQQVANDEHLSLEAFFQNPAQQDAFVQAVTLCSR
jgi:hypothetical protein